MNSVIARSLVWIVAFFLSFIAVSDRAAAAVFTSPEGIRFTSESAAWNSTDRLQQLYQELKMNAHGEELKLLAEVRVLDGYPKGKSIAGEYSFKTSVDLFNRQKMLPGTIDLYGGNERTTVESLAKTLSHEYGHHVTHYYSVKQDGFSITDKDRWRQSTYAKIRGLANDLRVNQLAEHRWELAEIAAEDYVQLFGSPTAKRVYTFPSRHDSLQQMKEIGPLRWDASMYNVVPQENLDLPLASEVPNLYQWYATHLGVRSQPDIPKKPELRIKEVIKHGDVGYQLHFVWSGENGQSNLTYTLVAYSDGDPIPEPIVTRQGTDILDGRYGTMVVRTASSILTYKDPTATGIRHFRVFAQNQAGYVTSSPILTVNMSHPNKVTITEPSVASNNAVNTLDVQVDENVYVAEVLKWADLLLRGIIVIMEALARILEEVFKFIS
ncbi:hypothetical protein EFBL_1339 [Effusibacillus lacus]|uniref:Uncharacterized protein n=2 Tax=Effusibacillus lacus TaxID=1348429 RepID=A0A292YMI5_9BACL|nr:hypothetical protein EFBL_1339 [Effusibacillus lacus]